MQDQTGESENIQAQAQEVTSDETTLLPAEEEIDERGGGDGKAKALGKPGLGDYGRPNRSN